MKSNRRPQKWEFSALRGVKSMKDGKARSDSKRTVLVSFTRTNGVYALFYIVPICKFCVTLLSCTTVQLRQTLAYNYTGEHFSLTVIAETCHSAFNLGIRRCAMLRPSFTPVRNLTVNGICPNVRFIPSRILPSLAGVSSTSSHSTKCQTWPLLTTYKLIHSPFGKRDLSGIHS